MEAITCSALWNTGWLRAYPDRHRAAWIPEFWQPNQGGLDFSAGGIFRIVALKKIHTQLSIF
jgi:hypothetical protein